MTTRTAPPLVLSVVVLAIGALVAFLLVLWEPAGPQYAQPDIAPAIDPNDEVAAPQLPPELVPAKPVREPKTTETLVTTVAWPLAIELDLVEDRSLPAVPAGPPLGSGRNARISGRITDRFAKGANARVRFTDGPNAGRELECDSAGLFGANDLYPGMAIVRVTGQDILGSRREVRLQQGKDELLNINYGRPSTVQGKIVDDKGEGVPGAFVTLDGLETETDERGGFFFIEVGAGRCLLEVTKEGFAATRMLIGVASGNVVQPGAIQILLRRPASLQLSLATDIGGPEPAQVFLMPARTNYERTFPWQTINPIQLTGSAPVVVHDLPEGPVHVRTYRTGAVAEPGYAQVNLHAGETESIQIRLAPAAVVVGNVFGPDGLVAGASVRYTAADPTRAAQRHFATIDDLWLDHVLPAMPASIQEVVADSNGHFRLTSWSNLSPFHLLEVRSPDGKLGATQRIGPEHDDTTIDVVLAPIGAERAQLVIELPGRTQALPVVVLVNGKPGAERLVSPDDDVEIDDLVPGLYRVRAIWHGERVATEEEFLIDGTTRTTWTLPEEAIVGQDEETWKKLERAYPRTETISRP